MNVYYDVIVKNFEKAVSEQKPNDGDYYSDSGILICGTCNEPRQEIRSLHPIGEEELQIKCVRMCKCDRQREAERKAKEAEIKHIETVKALRSGGFLESKFAEASFDTCRVTQFNQKNVKLCKRYTDKFGEMYTKGQGLLFWGGIGTGKSYMAACIANRLIDQEIRVIMTSFVKILETIQFNSFEESVLLDRIEKADLVIFDDLGAERNTDYALEKVYNFIDTRYRSGRPMIVTTNLTLEQMKEEQDIRYARLYDRIFEVCFPMQFTGHSFRKNTAYKKFKEMEELLGSD